MLSSLAYIDDHRRTRPFQLLDTPHPFQMAAERILAADGCVFLLTGFYIRQAGSIETDGLTGTWVLFHALRSLKRPVIIPADSITHPILTRLFPENHLVRFPEPGETSARTSATRMLEHYSPSVVIAIERPGPGADGIPRNARGQDLNSFHAPMELLWPDNAVTIGIGDGGNELGLGRLACLWTDSRPVCTVAADVTLLGSTSDFAAWTLAASLEIAARETLLPPDDDLAELLHKLQDLGVVDGMTGKPAPSIDGYDLNTVMTRYRRIRSISGMMKKTIHVLSLIREENRQKHPVSLIEVQPGYDPVAEGISLGGFVLLERQAQDIRSKLDLEGIPVTGGPSVLEDPEYPGPDWIHVPGLTRDLLNRPAGERTTQVADYDEWVRRLAVTGSWALIQTPDRAMGWSDDPYLRDHPGSIPGAIPWSALCTDRLPTGPEPLSLRQLIDTAERLLGIPYLWGGRSTTGIDCSGLTQRIFFRFGLLLPRHSGDQRRCGIRIPFSAMQPGDLLFATRLEEGFHHTGLLLPDGVQHACRSRNRVLIESIESFRSRYRLIAVRRISPFA